jgi:hypothetical protein
LDDLGLSQIVEVTTRGTNTLDLVITNHPSKIIRAETLPGISDHDIIFVEFDMIPTKKHHIPWKIPLYGKANCNN